MVYSLIRMPNGNIIKYTPGSGLCVVGFKALTANTIFIYSPGTGLCPVQNAQTKQAKLLLPVKVCGLKNNSL